MKTPNTKKPRHPDFDEAWAEHQRMLYWAATKVSKILGGKAENYWGILVIRFNTCLWGWNKRKGSFSTYFMKRIFCNTFREVKAESDLLSARYRRYTARDSYFKAKVLYGFNLNEMWHKDHKDYYSWPTDILLELNEGCNLRSYILAKLDKRQKLLIEKRAYEGTACMGVN